MDSVMDSQEMWLPLYTDLQFRSRIFSLNSTENWSCRSGQKQLKFLRLVFASGPHIFMFRQDVGISLTCQKLLTGFVFCLQGSCSCFSQADVILLTDLFFTGIGVKQGGPLPPVMFSHFIIGKKVCYGWETYQELEIGLGS